MARQGLQNEALDKSFVEWLKQVMQECYPEVGQDDKLQTLMGFAFQAGADAQRNEVEIALQFSATRSTHFFKEG